MKPRLLTAAFVTVAAASPARADDLTFIPTCAAIDDTRDTLTPEERIVARGQLVRALQDVHVLVVDDGCAAHYVLSHEREGDDTIVRLVGPGGIRRVRNPGDRARIVVYARLIDALLDAAAADDADDDAAREEDDDPPTAGRTLAISISDDVDEPADEPVDEPADDSLTAHSSGAVRGDSVFYAKLHTGNFAAGLGVGLRIPASTRHALDISLAGGSTDERSMVALGGRILSYARPDSSTTPYYGGGLSYATQSDYMLTGGGIRFDGVVGLALNRRGDVRAFVEGEVSLPAFSMEGVTTNGYTASDYAPTFMVSFGAGM